MRGELRFPAPLNMAVDLGKSSMLGATIYIFTAYLVASLWEASFHRFVLHASASTRRRWRHLGSLGALLRLACFFHHDIHHRRTFNRSLVVQFDAPQQKAKIDALLKGPIGMRARSDRYGLTVTGPFELLAFTGIPLSINIGLAAAACPGMLWAGAAIAFAPYLLSRYLHPLLHLPPQSARGTPLAPGWLMSAFRFIQRYHLTHHRLHDRNFNLLLGADFLLGSVAQRPGTGEP